MASKKNEHVKNRDKYGGYQGMEEGKNDICYLYVREFVLQKWKVLKLLLWTCTADCTHNNEIRLCILCNVIWPQHESKNKNFSNL